MIRPFGDILCEATIQARMVTPDDGFDRRINAHIQLMLLIDVNRRAVAVPVIAL